VTINVLPDDALLEIFDIYVNDEYAPMTQWHTPIHVCRRWRSIVFASPHRLNLRLVYNGRNPLKEILDIWPDLPVVILNRVLPCNDSRFGPSWDNIAGALDSGCHNRICKIHLADPPNSHLERFAVVMQKPFSALTDLYLSVEGDLDLDFQDSFLGGSAPHLRQITLQRCSFSGMQKLLLSANHLTTLHLWNIPHSGYISPDALVTALSVTTRLKTLHLQFRSPLSRPNPESNCLPPRTLTVLPVLTELTFKGVREYSEGLMSQIDAPLLQNLRIMFFMDLIFDVPQLYRFINHTEGFKTFHRAEMTIDNDTIRCTVSSPANPVGYRRHLDLEIRCRRVDWQLSSLAQVCSSSLIPLSFVEELEILSWSPLSDLHWKDDMEPENAQWLDLLDPFTVVKNLTLGNEVAPYFCHALEELNAERVSEVLPALQKIFLREDPSRAYGKAIKAFVTARRLFGQPVTVHRLRWGES